jgi:hypothetical protein
MALPETLLSIIGIIIVIYLGLKIIKNIIVTVIMIAVVAGILWYLGFLPF